MILIVGLGNPGKEYERTRHNVGFMAVDAFRQQIDASPWKLHVHSESEVSEGLIGDEKIFLVKPQTFMNLSGKSVQYLAHFYHIDPAKVFVVYDEADLPLGTVRIRLDGSSGGHNGVQSIIELLGTEQFPHVRVGVSNPVREERAIETKDFVLSTFSAKEKKILARVIEHTVNALQDAITKGVAHAISKWNGMVE